MNAPRIGDIVHYTTNFTPECHAAIVIARSGDEITARVLTPENTDYTVYPQYDEGGAHIDADGDTWEDPAGFTPGTWHHTH